MSRPIVRVIGFTSFVGIPEELLPEHGQFEVEAHGQDQGTDAERLIECAGRGCYDSYGRGRPSQSVWGGTRVEQGYHDHILDVGHGSVCEHPHLSFWISGISRACGEEWLRHRMAPYDVHPAATSHSKRSTRYVDESESEHVYHPLLQQYVEETGDPSLGTEIDLVGQHARLVYKETVDALEGWLRGKGVSRTDARKQARGAARLVLPLGLATEGVWTCDVRTLRDVLLLRATDAADGEMRLLANAVYEAALPYCPAYLSDFARSDAKDGVGYVLTSGRGRI